MTEVFGYPGVAILSLLRQYPEFRYPDDSDPDRTECSPCCERHGEGNGKGRRLRRHLRSRSHQSADRNRHAFADSIPLVCLTGQVNSELLGSDVFQEADITGAAESFVKYSYLVRDVNDIPRIFKEAFYVASTGRKGPVLIDIPIDIQNAQLNRFRYPEEVSMRTYKPTVKGHAVQIRKVIQELKKAKRPLIYAGGGVTLSGACEELRSFAEKFRIPVVSTMMGIGVMPTEHPMYFGMVGNNGKAYANRAMNESDLLIMVGARVADRSVNQPDIITHDKVLVHIDVDPAEIGKNAGPTIPQVGDARHIFADFESRNSPVIMRNGSKD